MTVSPVTPSALRSIPVELSTHPYPIVIGDGALGSLGAQVQAQGFKAGSKVLVVTNPVVNGHYGATALASLRAQDSRIGYKDLAWVMSELQAAGLGVQPREMPANNLMLVCRK